ncbi:cyclic lactone autoinducer peptide [uncultured Eubacterium sp.]|uniref:cyclic lactone autoinducer peptide n=1 Tax=uncultured Eubacterium sp. TaxID=165185 RepID=UPI0025E4A008|nr:cyclic lactone autoinducer peptide [uncultured Eubacterium sp.]
MRSQEKIYSNIIKKIATGSLSVEANSTSCIMLYQPKAPATLKKFSKVDNDK